MTVGTRIKRRSFLDTPAPKRKRAPVGRQPNRNGMELLRSWDFIRGLIIGWAFGVIVVVTVHHFFMK